MKINRLYRYSEYLSNKYNLAATAQSKAIDLAWIKDRLVGIYKGYIADPPKAYNIVPLLAQNFRDPFCIALIDNMRDLVTNIDKSTPDLLFEQVANISEMITEEQNNRQEIRNTIHSYFRRPNDREMAKNKFEAVVFEKIQNLLRKSGKDLIDLYPDKDFDKSRLGFPQDRQPKELSKQEMWMWIHGHPAAGKYGLDDEDIFAKIYEDLDLRHKLTKIIYATNRARSPRQIAKVKEAVELYMQLARQKITNEGLLEGGEEAEERRQQMVSPEEAWNAKMQGAKKDKALERAEEEAAEAEKARLAPLIEQRDEEHRQRLEKQKQIEEDRERHVRSEGAALLKALIKKRYL